MKVKSTKQFPLLVINMTVSHISSVLKKLLDMVDEGDLMSHCNMKLLRTIL